MSKELGCDRTLITVYNLVVIPAPRRQTVTTARRNMTNNVNLKSYKQLYTQIYSAPSKQQISACLLNLVKVQLKRLSCFTTFPFTPIYFFLAEWCSHHKSFDSHLHNLFQIATNLFLYSTNILVKPIINNYNQSEKISLDFRLFPSPRVVPFNPTGCHQDLQIRIVTINITSSG